jgi:hypothetical protein
MDCTRVIFSGHGIQRMFHRGIGRNAVLAVLSTGEAIANYPDDDPYPSRLLLGWVDVRPLHVVAACDPETETCIVVTAYEPSASLWAADFKTRRAV